MTRREWRIRRCLRLARNWAVFLAACGAAVALMTSGILWLLPKAHALIAGPEAFVARNYDGTEYQLNLADARLVLVNGNLPLDAEPAPALAVADDATGQQLEAEAAEQYRAMAAAAAADGITLELVTGYQDVSAREAAFDARKQVYLEKGLSEEEAAAYAACVCPPANASEQATGYAADILSPDCTEKTTRFADTRAYRSGEFRGKMEALAGVRSYLQGIRQDYVVLSDSDLIINLPLADVFAAHLESGADITAVCTANGGFVDNATYLTLESDGAIGQVWCAPTTPRGHRSLEIYILSKQLLLTLVDECSAQDKYSFRRDVLAGMTGRLKLQSYVWDGYAAQLRSVQEYYDRSMELLQGSIRAELFAAARPILAKEDDEASSYFAPGSRVKNSLVADGCTIEGSVENCILFPGVTVEKGTELRDSILFKGTRVRDGVTLRYVITDKYVEVLPGRTLMGHESYPIVISKGSIV